MTYDVSFIQCPLMALFDLKGQWQDIADWCGDALPACPSKPLTATRSDTAMLMWLAPKHWLLRAPLDFEQSLNARLRPAECPGNISLARISDSLTFFALTGPDLGEAMSIISPLDTHPGHFRTDSATFTEALGLKALVIRTAQGFEIGVDRSFGAMMATYLANIGLSPA